MRFPGQHLGWIRFLLEIETVEHVVGVAIPVSQRLQPKVILDEFQEILSIGGVQMLKQIRSRTQHHKHATYIFSGSKRHLLDQIFHEEEGAFYKSARPFELGPISRSAFEKFIVSRFEKSGGEIEPGSPGGSST